MHPFDALWTVRMYLPSTPVVALSGGARHCARRLASSSTDTCSVISAFLPVPIVRDSRLQEVIVIVQLQRSSRSSEGAPAEAAK